MFQPSNSFRYGLFHAYCFFSFRSTPSVSQHRPQEDWQFAMSCSFLSFFPFYVKIPEWWSCHWLPGIVLRQNLRKTLQCRSQQRAAFGDDAPQRSRKKNPQVTHVAKVLEQVVLRGILNLASKIHEYGNQKYIYNSTEVLPSPSWQFVNIYSKYRLHVEPLGATCYSNLLHSLYQANQKYCVYFQRPLGYPISCPLPLCMIDYLIENSKPVLTSITPVSF